MKALRIAGWVAGNVFIFAVAFGAGCILPMCTTFLLVNHEAVTVHGRFLFAASSLSLSILCGVAVCRILKTQNRFRDSLVALSVGLGVGSLSVFLMGLPSGWAFIYR